MPSGGQRPRGQVSVHELSQEGEQAIPEEAREAQHYKIVCLQQGGGRQACEDAHQGGRKDGF